MVNEQLVKSFSGSPERLHATVILHYHFVFVIHGYLFISLFISPKPLTLCSVLFPDDLIPSTYEHSHHR